MSENVPAPGTGAARKVHPAFVLAAIGVAAVSVIAAAQFLRPQDAQSQQAAAGAQTSATAKPGANKPAPAKPASPPRVAAASCPHCGVVVAVRESKQAGEGTGLGAVAGGVIGGVVGHQFGGGRGKDALTVVGAVGGAVAGHRIEKQARAKTVYHVDVKLNDGTTRTFNYGSPPGLAIGTQVEVNGDQLTVRG